jgi:hypothetical protein
MTLSATVFAFSQAPSTSAAPTQPPLTTSVPKTNPAAVANPPGGSPTDTPAVSPPKQPSQADQPQAHTQRETVITLYMPDGQLKSHSVAVYITHNIQEDQKPQLQLLRSHTVTDKEENEDAKIAPLLVAPNQEWTQTENNKQVQKTGTLLLFDIASADFFPKPMIRVRPVVYWIEGGNLEKVVGKNEVNVADILAACLWTLLITVVGLLLIIILASRVGKASGTARASLVQFLSAVDGHLSLGQTQIACWTIVVGSVVLGYGMIRLEIPTIPSSLLALMGASLATGGVAYFQDSQKQAAAEAASFVPAAPSAVGVRAPVAAVPAAAVGAPPAMNIVPHLADLVTNFSAGQTQGQLSLAKAQMIFWTVLLLVMFVSKSILEGAIWDIPWALVALMGFSQAGYLAPKIAPSP